MIIRCQMIGSGTASEPYGVDLPRYTMVAEDLAQGRAFVEVPDVDVAPDVAAFVRAYPVTDLVTPLPVTPSASLLSTWREHLARRYDLGEARWNPRLA